MKKMRPRNTLSPFEETLSRRLKDSPLPVVPPEEIAAAARNAAAWRSPAGSLWDRQLWRAALASLSVDAVPFWLLCAFLLGSGVAAGLLWGGLGREPLAVLVPLAPAPFLCFLIRELQIRDAALVQLERTCVLKPSQVCLIRLWAGTFINGGMVAFLGAIVGGEPLRFCLCAFTVLFFLGAAGLLLFPMGGSAMPLSLLLAAWMLGAFWLLSQQEFLEIIQKAALSLWMGAAGAGLGLFVLASLRASRKMYGMKGAV